MTICIGALAHDNGLPRIVMCCDSKVSTEGDEFSSETEYKIHPLNGHLISMFAGSPGRAKELAMIYREYLDTHDLEERRVVEQLREPISSFKRRLANAYLGRTLGLSYDEVLAKGGKWFGKEFQRRLLILEDHPIRVDLVIAGFIGPFPVLCELRHGELEWKTIYAMVGTGAYTAEPVMHARKHQEGTPLYNAIYNVFEAKAMSEHSPSVGSFTRLFILSPPEDNGQRMRMDMVSSEGMNYLKQLFEEYGPKPLPYQREFHERGLIRVR
jgi:hypothetical protein